MLKPVPFANALAAITVAFYVICWVIFQISPALYNFLINALSLGSDVAKIMQPPHETDTFLVALIVSGAIAWVTGYAFAWLYNKLSK